MPRTDKSVAFLTGMIIAALYVILLVSFSREAYVVRGGGPVLASAAPACADNLKQVDAVRQRNGAQISPAAQEAACLVSIQELRRLIGKQLKSPAVDDVEAAEAGSGDSE